MREVENEASFVVRRLRNHPSLVLWCGNNEIDLTYYSMYFTDLSYFDRFARIGKFYGETIWHETLPRVCAALDPTRPYWPSSPFSANSLDPNSPYMGDRHSWDSGWRGFYNDKAKFASEYGVPSPPNLETVITYMPVAAEPDRTSPVWKWHSNTMDSDNAEINIALEKYYIKNQNVLSLPDYILAAQWAQGETYRLSFEYYRRRKFLNSGALFWMYADSWGTVG